MPIDEVKQNGLLDRYVSDLGVTGHVAATDRAHPPPTGTWTIDPAESSVSIAWPKCRLGSIAGRLHCLGVIHLDALPPVGVIKFEQPSGLPVLTMSLNPASVQTHDVDLDARLRSAEIFEVQRHRWWTLRSESLEVLPTGLWRVMATLTASDTAGLVELRLEVDSEASDADWLVLRGQGVLDRHAFGIGRPAPMLTPRMRLDLSVRARRVGGPHPHLGEVKHMHNQHAGLSQQLAAQRITERHQQAAQARLAQHADRSRRRHHRWRTRRWWRLVRRPGTAVTRMLLIGAMLAAMHLAATTAVAQAHATDSPPAGPPTERQVGEAWRHRQATSQNQSAAEATRKRVQARERFSTPNATPAEVPAPVPPNQRGPSDWLVAWLGGLVAALALAGGLGVHAARRTRRRARLEHAS